MPRFFLPADLLSGDTVVIGGEDALHISRSLRMRAGEHITVCDMNSAECDCEITGLNADTVSARIISRSENETEPHYRALLYQALPKGDKFDYIVQKAVELGVDGIVPFIAERSISRPDADAALKKVARWQKIADGAAGQCGRGILPKVYQLLSCENALSEAARAELPLFCYEGDGTAPLFRVTSQHPDAARGTISFVIGPEGGFTPDEVELAKSAGFEIVGLGRRILRCETASAFVLSCLCFAYDM